MCSSELLTPLAKSRQTLDKTALHSLDKYGTSCHPVPEITALLIGAANGKKGSTDLMQGNAEELNLLPMSSCARWNKLFKPSFPHVATNDLFPILFFCDFRLCD